jgi:hypothetical protein
MSLVTQTPPADGAPPRTKRKLALIGLVAVLILQAVFAIAYVGALHDPQPHDVPIGVLDARTAAAVNASGGALAATSEPSPQAMIQDLRERDISGGLIGHRLYVASGAGYSTSAFLQTALRQKDPSLQVVDVAPLPSGDSRGLSLFYATIAWVFGGYLAATVITTLLGARARGRRIVLERTAAIAGYGVAAGIAGALILDQAFGAVGGHFWSIAGIGALISVAVGMATMALQSVFGMLGSALATVAFVMFGNAASGGPYSGDFLPGFWRTIGSWLPSGAGVDSLRSAVYLDGANVAGGLLRLCAYVLAGTAVVLAVSWRARQRHPEIELAAPAAA